MWADTMDQRKLTQQCPEAVVRIREAMLARSRMFPRSHPSLVMNESFDHCAFGEVFKKRTRLLMWRSGSCKSGVADLTRTLRKCSCGKKHEQLSGLEAKEIQREIRFQDFSGFRLPHKNNVSKRHPRCSICADR